MVEILGSFFFSWSKACFLFFSQNLSFINSHLRNTIVIRRRATFRFGDERRYPVEGERGNVDGVVGVGEADPQLSAHQAC